MDVTDGPVFVPYSIRLLIKKDLMTYFEEISFEREAHDNSH